MSLVLPSKVYNFLKWLCLIVTPAISSLIVGFSSLFNWNIPVDGIVGTISLGATFIGAVLGVSNYNYAKGAVVTDTGNTGSEVATFGFVLPDKVYGVLKWICLIAVPALSSLIVGLATLWGWNIPVDAIVGTLSLVTTFVGAILGISNYNYDRSLEAQ